jgi:ubiquinone/menaquinone biosynthesis C-methylase UbiE
MTINKILDFLACPYCHSPKLILDRKKIFCGQCRLSFEVISGVPILIKENNLSNQEREQKKWYESYYSCFSNQEYRLEKWRLSMLKRIFNAVNKMKVRTYLDIGCGSTGYTVIEAAKRNHWLSLGIDISLEAMLKAKFLARKQKVDDRTAFLVASAENLPFKNNCFNYVSAISVLEHLNNDLKAIKEASRILKKGGWFYLCLPNSYRQIYPFFWPLNFYVDKKIGHQRHYALRDLEKNLQKTGFRLENFFYNAHLLKFGQVILDRLHLINNKNWCSIEKKDLNQDSRGLHLNALFEKDN